MKDLENHVATGEQEQLPPRSSLPRSAVAQCCINSAVMLRFADSGELSTKEKLAAVRKANEGQARLLEGAADIADEMLAALREIVEPTGGDVVDALKRARDIARAAIAKATGAA